MLQLREIHEWFLTNPHNKLETSMYQFKQIHVTTWRNSFINFGKSNKLEKSLYKFDKSNKLSKFQQEEWVSDWQDKGMIGLGCNKDIL